MEYSSRKIGYGSPLNDIEFENGKIDEMYECNMLHEVTLKEFLSDTYSDVMPGDFFNGLYIKDIDHDGNKVVFISLTNDAYDTIGTEGVRSIDPGNKGRMKILAEYENILYFVFKDKEGKYYYQRFFD